MLYEIPDILKAGRKLKIFLVLFYLVGVAGMLIPVTSGLFIILTPWALLMNALLLMLNHQEKINLKTIFGFVSVYLLGFGIEVFGVQSGLIFGSYSYGSGLGIKVFQTPLMIGINWLMLTYMTSSITEKWNIRVILKIVIGSLMMLLYDFILEQIAPKLDMWSWENDTIPLQNYISWFVIALIFQTMFRLSGIKTKNSLSAVILGIQFAFFVLLLMLI